MYRDLASSFKSSPSVVFHKALSTSHDVSSSLDHIVSLDSLDQLYSFTLRLFAHLNMFSIKALV